MVELRQRENDDFECATAVVGRTRIGTSADGIMGSILFFTYSSSRVRFSLGIETARPGGVCAVACHLNKPQSTPLPL